MCEKTAPINVCVCVFFAVTEVLVLCVIFLLCTSSLETSRVALLQICECKCLPGLRPSCLFLLGFACLVLEAFQFAEFFAGESNVTWCLKEMGLAGLKFDYDYGGRYNNIFEPAGFAYLVPQFLYE